MEPHEELEAMIGKVARITAGRNGHTHSAAGRIAGYIGEPGAISVRFESGYNFRIDLESDWNIDELVLVGK